MNLKKIEVIPMSKKPWTTAQKQYLRDNYKTQTYAQIAQATGHPAGSVARKARDLRLIKKPQVVLTDEETDFLRRNYNLISRKKLSEALGVSPTTLKYKAEQLGLVKTQWPQETGGVPMEKALPPDQCDKMRTFLRAWVHYGKTYGEVSATKFLQGWRQNECGFVKANNRNKRVAGGQP
jgi:hypothetical protein